MRASDPVDRAVAELLGIIDVRVGAAQRVSQESVSLADQSERFAVKPSLSSLGLTEERRAIVQPDAHQSLALSETYSDLIGFIVQIAEALSVVDRVSTAVVHLDPEQLEVLDRVLRASEAVIADLAFRSTPLDAEGFAALVAESRPLGYGPFRDLTPGDYEYARALLRLALEAPSTTGSRVALAEARQALGETAAAIADWRKVLESNSYARARVQLAELLASAGDMAGAREQAQETIADDVHAPAFQRGRDKMWVRRAGALLARI